MTMAGSVESPTAPSRWLSRSGTDGEQRIEQQQQPAAAGQILGQQLRLARRECRARTDIGDDRAIGRDGVRLRRDDAAHLVADLGQRELEPVELFRLGDQHVAGARRIMPLESLDMAVVKMRRVGRKVSPWPVTKQIVSTAPEHAQRRIGRDASASVVFSTSTLRSPACSTAVL